VKVLSDFIISVFNFASLGNTFKAAAFNCGTVPAGLLADLQASVNTLTILIN
jgi:hypothetical protein